MNPGTELTPPQASHPGLFLKRELSARKIKQNELAADAGIQATQLNQIINCKRAITSEQALLLGAALGISAQALAKMQWNYDLHKATLEAGTHARLEAVEQLKTLKEYIDVSYFRKEGVVTGRPAADVQGLLKVHDTDTVPSLIDKLTKGTYAGLFFKKSEKLSEHQPFVNSWISYVKHKASAEHVAPIDFSCQSELLSKLKIVFQDSDVRNKLRTTLKHYGIKLITQHNPAKTPLDGAAFWHDGSPILALTERHSRYDNYLFTVYHELGHIFLHLQDKKNRDTDFVDSLDTVNATGISKQEEEANDFARNTLVPADEWAAFTSRHVRFTDDVISRFAKAMEVPAPTILGRLCFDRHLDYSCNSVHKKNNQIP